MITPTFFIDGRRYDGPWDESALANAGVALRMDTFGGRERLIAALIAGLVIGKPTGILAASALAVAARLAVKPKAYSRPQLAGAGALAGIGFTMSLFIAAETFRSEADFEGQRSPSSSPRFCRRSPARHCSRSPDETRRRKQGY
jgi:hypothetical protein